MFDSARKPDPPGRELRRNAAERAISYLAGLDGRSVAPAAEALERLRELNEPFPEEPSSPAATLALLDEVGSPATVASAGSRFFGFVIGGTLPAALAANWLAGAWDQNAGLEVASPVAAALERACLRWLTELFSLPHGSAGGFVTGATMANFTGLAAARHALLARRGWDAEAQGLFGAPTINVVVGDEVHISLLKALGMLGLGRERVLRVPVDGQGRMRSDALPPLDASTILCLQAGNVNTGSFDPAKILVPWAREAGAWVHVDGAFGLWAAAAPTTAHLLAGYEAADSWATDAHKWLNVPYDSGLVFVRDASQLVAAMSSTAAYLMKTESRDGSDYVPEISRRARGVEVWAALRSLGRRGLATMVERSCRQARDLAEALRSAGYEILNDVVLNQVLVSFGDAQTTSRVVAAIQEEGTLWAGGTVWQGKTAMRISLSSWATTEADLERALHVIEHVVGQALRKEEDRGRIRPLVLPTQNSGRRRLAGPARRPVRAGPNAGHGVFGSVFSPGDRIDQSFGSRECGPTCAGRRHRHDRMACHQRIGQRPGGPVPYRPNARQGELSRVRGIGPQPLPAGWRRPDQP